MSTKTSHPLFSRPTNRSGRLIFYHRVHSYNSLRCHFPRGSRLARTPSRRRSERVAWGRSIAHAMHV